MKTKLVAGVALVVLISGLLWGVLTREKVLVEVGTVKITDKDVRLAIKALKSLPPSLPLSGTSITEPDMLTGLVNAHSLIEMLKLKGVNNIDDLYDEAMALFEWGNEINPVEKTLGNDTQKLRKLFLAPLIAQGLVFSQGYLKDANFQQSKEREAEKILSEILKNPRKFSEVASRGKLPIIKGIWKVEKLKTFKKPNLHFTTLRSGPEPRNTEEYRKDNLVQLAAGEVLGHLVERNEGWWIVRNQGAIASRKDEANFEAFVIRRDPFPLWLRQNHHLVTVKWLQTSN